MAVSDCALPVAPQLVGNQWWSGSSARSHGDTDLFAAEVERGGLKRSSLKEFLASARDASAQLVSNLSRAAERVQSFKQVAVDQSRSDRRSFDVSVIDVSTEAGRYNRR